MKIFSLFLLLFVGAAIVPQKAPAQGVSVSMQVFYDELSPYGTWVYSNDYGYVWIPDADPGFSPYATNGYWVLTNEGWTWVSYYSWGWAPFHYGRWYTDPYYGPMWVPDYEWGPGWVTWRRSGDYYGWAPIGPGVSINVAYGNDYYVPNDRWTYVRNRDFGRRDINNYYVDNSTNVTIINNSTVINNTRVDRTNNVTYNAGPDRVEVEKHVGKTITPVAIKESSTPGQNLTKNQLQIYRPKVQKNVASGSKPAPSKVTNLQDVKPASQRSGTTSPQKVNKTTKQQPAQQQKGQPGKQQPAKQQNHPDQPAKQQPAQQQNQPDQPAKQQPAQQQNHPDQPAKQQPAQQQNHPDQPAKQQPAQQQNHPDQPAKQQPAQQQNHPDQPAKQQPAQQQNHPDQPSKQQPGQQQQIDQPAKQQPSEPQKTNQPRKAKQPRQPKPPRNTGGEKPPR